jgi:D-aminopeptidase
MPRPRLRDLGISIGLLPPGPHNAITDVPGVRVGHTTLIYDAPRLARTGVTLIVPRDGNIWRDHAFAACHVLNGTGEMTGTHWLAESGMLCYPIALTNTHQVGLARDTLTHYGQENGFTEISALPVAAETWDGWLNDLDGQHVTAAHVLAALAAAAPGPVPEGNVGAGTGTICADFKGGIGTASRVAHSKSGPYTVGALLQTNHGDREALRVDGVPVGREIGYDRVPSPWNGSEPPKGGSVIVILATDAPLLPFQCKALAQRATLGLARACNAGHHGSGDIFLAFATGNHLPARPAAPQAVNMLPNDHLDPLFEAAAEAVEEAVLNSLTTAETTTGYQGRTAHALPLEDMLLLMRKYGRG